MSIFIEFIGWIAAICTTFAFIPQVLKVSKTRSVKDISVSMYFVFCSGVFMWVIYGFYLNSIPIVLANTITFGLAAAILIMKIKWNKLN
jgi:MtN3 and saliva related transmembrane protein